MNDRREGVDAIGAEVGDGEGAAGELVGAQLAGAHSLGEAPCFGRDLAYREAVGMSDDRHDETVLEEFDEILVSRGTDQLVRVARQDG